jgi:hypothetical protein
MIVKHELYSNPAITRIFDGQEEKYPTTKAKLDHSRKCLALCKENGYKNSIEAWEETVAALEQARLFELMPFNSKI